MEPITTEHYTRYTVQYTIQYTVHDTRSTASTTNPGLWGNDEQVKTIQLTTTEIMSAIEALYVFDEHK